MNGDKSSIFFGGVQQEQQGEIAQLVSMRIGALPITYLGVPHKSSSIKCSSYNVIIDRMTARINFWAARCLSYAGRLVLLKHILSSICSYWMHVIIFPKGVVKKITAICRNFLWSGKCSGKRNLVKWRSVCLPKEYGGLGLKNLEGFNKALALSHIWDCCNAKESLWVRWMNSYYFRMFNYWNLDSKVYHSWTLKNLLKLKTDAAQCVDQDIMGGYRWKGSFIPFSTKDTYDLISQPHPKLSWSIWNRVSPLKHSFCAWLSINGRLSTGNRFEGGSGSSLCCWCNSVEDTNPHIIFGCPQMPILSSALLVLGYSVNCSCWEELLDWFTNNTWSSRAEKMAVLWFGN